MSAGRGGGSERLSSASAHGVRLWRGLPHERRLAAIGAVGLFLSLFLPWYQGEVITGGVSGLRGLSYTLTGWQSFSWVEAAVLLVAVGVLVLLVMRARGNAFHVPGGDGNVIAAAGLWTCVLVLWRMFDKQGVTSHTQYDTATGIEWGIFITLGVAAFLAWSGSRIRAAHEVEPPLPGETAPRQGSRRRWRRDVAGPRTGPTTPGASAGSAAPPSAGRQATTVVRSAPMRPSHGPTEPPTEVTQRRPSSTDRHSAPTEHRPADGDRHAAPTERDEPRSAREDAPSDSPSGTGGVGDAEGAGPESRRRGLDPREIQELNLAEPPTARLGRSRPSTPPPSQDDDQLTIRLDRPN